MDMSARRISAPWSIGANLRTAKIIGADPNGNNRRPADEAPEDLGARPALSVGPDQSPDDAEQPCARECQGSLAPPFEAKLPEQRPLTFDTAKAAARLPGDLR